MHWADFPQDSLNRARCQGELHGQPEYCSGPLSPKVVLGEMRGPGRTRLIKAPILGGNSGWSEAAPGGHEKNGISGALFGQGTGSE